MFCFGETGMVAVFPTDFIGTLFDMFSTFHFPEQAREQWERLYEDRTAKQETMVQRYGHGGWPEFIS